MNSEKTLIIILISAACTLFLRALPFVFLGGKKKIPKKIEYLGKVLPPAIMAVLIIYCLKDVPYQMTGTGILKLIAAAAVALSYIWKGSSFFSIILGTGIYMGLLQII